jgi:NDP-sugar pyrophosphorylase family protein
MKPISLVIPAAGLGSRFRQVGYTTPKPLIEILGRPMLMWVVSNFHLSPIDQIIIISLRSDDLPKRLNLNVISGVKSISFVELDGLTGGPAETVMAAASLIPAENAVIVANSDQFLAVDSSAFIDSLRGDFCSGLIMTMQASGSKWSYVGRAQDGRILSVVEKKEISSEATVGIYGWGLKSLMTTSILNMMNNNDRTNGEFYVAPSYNYLIKEDIPVDGIWIGLQKESVFGLGTPEDLNYFLESGVAAQFISTI